MGAQEEGCWSPAHMGTEPQAVTSPSKQREQNHKNPRLGDKLMAQ